MSTSPPSASQTPEPASEEVEVHDNDVAHFLERVLQARYEVEARARGKLGINSEVVVELEAIPRAYSEDLVRLAVRSARSHPKDKYVLMEDVHWARSRLLSGSTRSPLPQILTTIGGLLFGIGAPMFLGAITAATDTVPLVVSNVALGAGISLAGGVLLAWGIAITIRRT